MIDEVELAEVIVETLDGIINTTSAPPPQAERELREAHIHASVAIEGSTTTTFTLDANLATAIELAALWSQLPTTDIGIEDACDAVAELSNLLAGSVKTLIDDETVLATPTAKLIDQQSEIAPGLITVDHTLGSFEISLQPPSP